MKAQSRFIILTVLFMVYSFAAEAQTINLNPGEVHIEGSIENFAGDFKTGRLTYFDAISRIQKDIIFSINEKGQFHGSFNLMHPIYESCYIELGDDFYSGFYLEPGVNYRINIHGEKLQFIGETAFYNILIAEFNDALRSALRPIINEERSKHEEGLTIDEYLDFQKKFEQQKSNFLKSYTQVNTLPPNIEKLLENEIKYKTAHAWINYRFDYSTGWPVERDSLPVNFYADLFSSYPVNSFADCQSRYCNDYISNMVTVLTRMNSDVDHRMEFYRRFNWFTELELNMIAQRFQGNEEVLKSEDYSNFNTKENSYKMRELASRFLIHSLLENIHLLPEGVGRSMVISQGISRIYLDNNFSPLPEEWEKIENQLVDQALLEYLRSLFIEEVIPAEFLSLENDEINSNIDSVLARYIKPYKGKVIYIDFYATWCGPCRMEVPYAKTLFMEMKGKDIVFLNLCAQSRVEDWQNYVSQRGIEGENFLLSGEEYILLSKYFDVHAFPTYILIDKHGNLANKNAPRPSSGYFIREEIIPLLN